MDKMEWRTKTRHSTNEGDGGTRTSFRGGCDQLCSVALALGREERDRQRAGVFDVAHEIASCEPIRWGRAILR